MARTAVIRNKAELATSVARSQALDIIEAGIRRVLPRNLVSRAVRYDPGRRTLTVLGETHELRKGRMFIVGGGKAAGKMAEAFEEAVGPEHIAAGVVTCSSGDSDAKTVRVVDAGIPFPDQRGLDGVRQMLSLREAYSIGKNDLVVCLLSGGGSALMPFPAGGLSLEDKQRTTQLLLTCGAEIGEINAVRKHLSRVKGGRLGQFFSPARVVSLILSDVVGNHLDVIASGPTFPDPSTFLDALGVLRKYGLLAKVPKSVMDILQRGVDLRGEVPHAVYEDLGPGWDILFNPFFGNRPVVLLRQAEIPAQRSLRRKQHDPDGANGEQTGLPVRGYMEATYCVYKNNSSQ